MFAAYRDAGAAWIQQAEIYASGRSAFLYSPLIAAFYLLFAFLSQNLSEALWRLILGVTLPLAVWHNAKAVFGFPRDDFAFLLLLILLLTLSNLNNGQANLILIGLLLVAATAAAQCQWGRALFVPPWKIYPIVFALLLTTIFPKKLTLRICLMLIGLLAFSLILQKPSDVLREYGSWLVHLASDRCWLNEYYGKWRDFYLLRRLVGIPISATWWKVYLVHAVQFCFALCFASRFLSGGDGRLLNVRGVKALNGS